MGNTVYILDLPLTEKWDFEEISRLTSKYVVEIHTISQLPYRAVAMNRPLCGGGDPICLTWGTMSMLQEASYKDCWAGDWAFESLSRRFDFMPGRSIEELINRMIECMVNRLGTVVGEFNGVEVVVHDGDSVEERHAWWLAETERKHAEYLASLGERWGSAMQGTIAGKESPVSRVFSRADEEVRRLIRGGK